MVLPSPAIDLECDRDYNVYLLSLRGKEFFDAGDEPIGGRLSPKPMNVERLICSICYEACTNDSLHHLCCLPCGHLYGSSCIYKWLQLSKVSTTCPQCKHECSLTDIKKLFPSQFEFAAIDEATKKRSEFLEAQCASLLKLNSVKLDIVESMEAFKDIKDKLLTINAKGFSKVAVEIETKLDTAIAHQKKFLKLWVDLENPDSNS